MTAECEHTRATLWGGIITVTTPTRCIFCEVKELRDGVRMLHDMVDQTDPLTSSVSR